MLVMAIIGTNDSIIDVACWPKADIQFCTANFRSHPEAIDRFLHRGGVLLRLRYGAAVVLSNRKMRICEPNRTCSAGMPKADHFCRHSTSDSGKV
jgi:hypothetical protein